MTVVVAVIQMQLALRRFGWMRAIACLFCSAAIAAWGLGVPFLQRQVLSDQCALPELRTSLSIQVVPEKPCHTSPVTGKSS